MKKGGQARPDEKNLSLYSHHTVAEIPRGAGLVGSIEMLPVDGVLAVEFEGGIVFGCLAVVLLPAEFAADFPPLGHTEIVVVHAAIQLLVGLFAVVGAVGHEEGNTVFDVAVGRAQ